MVKKYQTPDGRTFYHVYIQERSKLNLAIRKQRHQKRIKTLDEAIAIEDRLIKQVQREVFEAERMGANWEQVIESFDRTDRSNEKMGLPALQTETRDDYVATLYKWTRDWLKRSASQINIADVRDVIVAMQADGVSNSHQVKMKQVIRKVFTHGLETRMIRDVNRCPTEGFKLTRKHVARQEGLNSKQIQILLSLGKEHEPSWYPIWAVALYTGMRNGELYALTWDKIDFENKVIHVSESFNSRKQIVKCTKSGERRQVPINSELEALLKELKLSGSSRKHVLPRMWQWDQGMQAACLRKFCLQVGLPSVRFHDLRASFATELLRLKIAPLQVMLICGWKDLKTMQMYIRRAGLEISGATDGLVFQKPAEVMGKVMELFSPKQ